MALADENRDFWWQQARKTTRQINLGWWLDRLSMPLLVGALISSAACLLLRRLYPEWPLVIFIGISGLVISSIALAAYFIARKHFEKPSDGIVRLEASMGLHNALSAANAGIFAWPEKSPITDAGFQWHWPRLLVPTFGALLLFSGGWFLPISQPSVRTTHPEQPLAWQKLDAELQRLEDEQVVDESYLEETRKKLEELKSQEEEQWFSHSSLEATDSLEKSHRSESEKLQEELENASKSLEALDSSKGNIGREEQQQQLAAFEKSMQSMQNGAMKPNPELLEQMKQLNPENLGKLSPEQMQQLKENLKKHSEAMENSEQNGEGQGDDWSDELMSGDQPGRDGQPGSGESGNPGPGKGGMDRGPGHDPNLLGNEKNGIDIGDPTALQAEDLSRAIPGDLLELQNGEHQVDRHGSKITTGGNTDATGKGGDRIWKESLDPQEQRAVKRFFE